MKILLVHNSYQQPGGEDVVFEQERQLLESAGHKVISYRRSNWEASAYSGLRRLALLRRTVWAADTRRDVVRLLDEEKPDLVHVHNTFVMISPSIYSACREAGIPVVQTLHNYRLYCPCATFFRDGHTCEDCIEHSLWQSVRHSCYRDSRAATAAVAVMIVVHRQQQTWTRDVNSYIALSEFARSRFINAGLPADKIWVKPNFMHPDPGARPHGEGEFALFVGRLSPEKRVSTMLSAWKHLNTVPLVVVGGGPERSRLEVEADTHRLGNVTFKGQLPREQTLTAMHQARFLVFSSEWYENFPMTIVEGFACGLPVICSRIGAMQELVEDGRTGLHFNSGDADDLAKKVQWAWDHPKLMEEMGQEARRVFETKYTTKQNYPLLMNIYQHAMTSAVTIV